MTGRTPASIAEVIASGLCIGCGLCEAIGGKAHGMKMTAAGSLRPRNTRRLAAAHERLLLSACPGIQVAPRSEAGGLNDPVWGCYRTMHHAWAGDSEVRFRAATGGVLTALGMHLLRSGKVDFILHVRADPAAPLRSIWTMSESPADVLAATGSRYGPAAPLAGLTAALERGQPFAIIAKPCDLSTVHNLSASDPRVDELCIYRLALVCGGQSRLRKSQRLLQEIGITEDDLKVFRYRGHGNPGVTHIETRNGDVHERTYAELWENEAGWEIETRCKLCPDALGEAADIAASDAWPGGAPVGEDEGFNGAIVRTDAGEALMSDAVATGDIVLGEPITPDRFNILQPHQVNKKVSLKARYQGMTRAGSPLLQTQGLRINELSQHLSAEDFEHQMLGTEERVRIGRFSEDVEV